MTISKAWRKRIHAFHHAAGVGVPAEAVEGGQQHRRFCSRCRRQSLGNSKSGGHPWDGRHTGCRPLPDRPLRFPLPPAAKSVGNADVGGKLRRSFSRTWPRRSRSTDTAAALIGVGRMRIAGQEVLVACRDPIHCGHERTIANLSATGHVAAALADAIPGTLVSIGLNGRDILRGRPAWDRRSRNASAHHSTRSGWRPCRPPAWRRGLAARRRRGPEARPGGPRTPISKKHRRDTRRRWGNESMVNHILGQTFLSALQPAAKCAFRTVSG